MSRPATYSLALLLGALFAASTAAAPAARAQEAEVEPRSSVGHHHVRRNLFFGERPFFGEALSVPGYGSIRGQVHLSGGDDARVDVEVDRVGSRCCLFGRTPRGYVYGPLFRSGSRESGGWWEGLGLFEEREEGEPDG